MGPVQHQDVADELGLNFSTKLGSAANATRTGGLDANGNIVFDKGAVNFACAARFRIYGRLA